MKEILKQIYNEKEFSINVSLFFGAAACFIVYVYKNDFKLGIVAAVMVFSIIKTVVMLIENQLKKKQKADSIIKTLSPTEMIAINHFIDSGSNTIFYNDINDENIMNGIRSLVNRDKAETFIEPSADPDQGPIGAILSEELYEFFLKIK